MKESYLQSVRFLLDCPSAERERLMAQLSGAVAAYLEDTPEATEADLTANFGTPEDCAAWLLEDCDPEVMAAERRRRRRRNRIIGAILAVIAAISICFALYMRATSGTKVIEHTHYVEGLPEDFPSNSEFEVGTHYND